MMEVFSLLRHCVWDILMLIKTEKKRKREPIKKGFMLS